MSVNQAGAEITALCVDLHTPGIGTDTNDDSVAHGNVAFDDFLGEYIYNFGIFNHKSCISIGCI